MIMVFKNPMSSSPCEPDVEFCGDDCSGIDSWTIAVYKEDVCQGFPNYECGELDCIEPLFSCSGTECPFECTSECITEDFHSIIINLTDKVGNEFNGLIYQYSEDEDIITIWDGLIFPPNDK